LPFALNKNLLATSTEGMTAQERQAWQQEHARLRQESTAKRGPRGEQDLGEHRPVPRQFDEVMQVAPPSMETVLVQGRDADTGQYGEGQMHAARPSAPVDQRKTIQDIIDRAPTAGVAAGSVASALVRPLADSGVITSGQPYEAYQITDVHQNAGSRER
jgi:hypothetical protein